MAEISIAKISQEPDSERPLWTAVGELCCRTGNNGDPIPRQRWELFERIWIEPYRRLAPQWSYVALADRRVVGYLTGCPDTARFARAYFMRCAMPLIGQVVFGRYRGDAFGRRFARQTLGLEASVERSFPRQLRRDLRRQFPAHLHTNVAAEFRRGGVGSRLIERFVTDLQERGVAGVHLFCGAGPLAFYRRMGFTELAVVPMRGHNVHAMGLSF